jgi:hypothetical protein
MAMRESKIQNQARFSTKSSWWSCRGEAVICCTRVGLALCVLLHSSLWVFVSGGSVYDLVDACVRCNCVCVVSSELGLYYLVGNFFY